jgi:hypothetical protein
MCLVYAVTVNITHENSASQGVLSAVLIALSAIMMIAALVQIGLITKPAWQTLQRYIYFIVQRVYSNNHSGSGGGGGSAVTDIELTETVRGVDEAAVGSTVTASQQQQHSAVGQNRRPSVEGLLSQGREVDSNDDSIDSVNHARNMSSVPALSPADTASQPRSAYAY